jgi:hypothetical protein
MPSYLDFDSTKSFRDALISKTLQVPNGPQTFSSTSYSVENTNNFSNKDNGDVVGNESYNRVDLLKNSYAINRFGPENSSEFLIVEEINTIPSLGNLALYPYFQIQDVLGRSLIGALNSSNYEFESKLAQFSNRYLTDSPDGPVQSRIRQNLQTATLGRLRILDALQGNTSTAVNLLTGRENLVEKNNKITVAKSLAGKAIDFVQTVAGVEFPFSEIPGDYLSNPANPINYRPEPKTKAGALLQDITGVLGSLVGISRRPKRSSKPSDLMYEYMGSGQKDVLHDNLSFSKYKPDYTTVARSQQSSKLFNFPNAIAQGIKNLIGAEAPRGNAYIGDDRSENAIYAMSDFNGNMVRSPYYLSLLFDPIQTRLFQNEKNISEGGQISGKLTWYSTSSKNKLGTHNSEYESERSKLEESLSRDIEFREGSILAKTQELLNSMPLDGAQSRTHVGNAIDQTSRIFKEGDVFLSRGSAIKYVNKVTGTEDGTEYCRVWTKDRSYMNYSDTMKREGLIRKFDESVISTPWNLNIAPMSNGMRDFGGSTNIIPDSSPDSFDGKAKKYMFSIENLAWKTSNKPGFTVSDLPVCERGYNGGRVMWFPPYDLKVNEVNSVDWDTNKFLGRPEPIYTYKGTERSGTISFKVVVDHPSILNLLIKDISDEDAENYLNAFFAGCETVDFYDLVRRYSTLDKSDLELIIAYLEYYRDGKTKDPIDTITFRNIAGDTTTDNGRTTEDKESPGPLVSPYKAKIFFPNDVPKPSNELYANTQYDSVYTTYMNGKDRFLSILDRELNNILTIETTNNKLDREIIFGEKNPLSIPGNTITSLKEKKRDEIIQGFNDLEANFASLSQTINTIKGHIEKNEINKVSLFITSTTSFVADISYNILLSFRRSDSIIKYVLKTLSKDGNTFPLPTKYWKSTINQLTSTTNPEAIEEFEIPLSKLGYGDDNNGVIYIKFTNKGENATISTEYDCNKNEIRNTGGLKEYAPITFYCRASELEIVTETKSSTIPGTTIPGTTTTLPGRTEIGVERTEKNRKPPLDVVKKIIMKTLSECFYFKKLEEKDPVVFNSLKEKLRYFHPAFHSMTPEGLNSRLTFLQQCIRPGDTIPVKGLGTDTNIAFDARNTSFGPPPVCIIRIGDFYHSKIVITNINISYENGTWDMNPEGIGMQPMLADVTLQVNFIGGQGLKEPVAKLQNALSSNFYANTEIYDYRADSTIDAKELYERINKDFLEKLLPKETPKTPTSETSPDAPIDGKYIGSVTNNSKLRYNDNIKSIIDNTNNYFKSFGETYNELQKLFGAEMLPLFISPTYRIINQLDIQNTISTTTQISLLGKYKKGIDFTNLSENFTIQLTGKTNTSDHNIILDLDIPSGSSKYERSRKIIDPLITTYVTEFLESLRENKLVSNIEKARDLLIEEIDKVNFIMSTNGIDGKTEKGNVTALQLTDFDHTNFYNKYDNAIDLISNKGSIFTDGLDSTFNFNSVSFTDENYKKVLSFIIKDKVSDIISKYSSSADKDLFDKNTVNKIERRLKKFISNNLNETKDKKFKYKEVEIKKVLDPYATTEGTLTSAQQDVLKKIHTSNDGSTNKLNFSKSIK